MARQHGAVWAAARALLTLALLDSAVSFLAPAFLGGAAPGLARCPGGPRGAPAAARLGVFQLRAATAAPAAKPAAKPRGYWREWANVEAEIRLYIAEHDECAGGMPATSQLRKNGLSSLADAIGRFGGVQEVAGRMGLACGKPKGYWQDYANTRREFEAFLAGWRAAAGEPDGVPTQENMRAAGRHDIVAALQLHGGMQRLAEDLDLTFYNGRRSGAGAVSGVQSGRHKIFQGRLWSFIAVNGTNGYMPSTEVLRNFGCDKLAEDVERLGGAVRVAKRFGLKPQRRPIGLELIHDALVSFVATSETAGVLPSKEQLAVAGRLDLDAKLEDIGRERVCKFLGLYMDEHAKLQAACDSEEALTSPAFVALAVKTQKPTLERGAGSGDRVKRKTFVRTAPLFKGDTRTAPGAAQHKAALAPRASTQDVPGRRTSNQQTARASTRSAVARSAAEAIREAVDSAKSEGRSLEEMKASFRRRLAASSDRTPASASAKVTELDTLVGRITVTV